MKLSRFVFVFDAIAVVCVLAFSFGVQTGADRLLRVKELKSERLQFLLD